ncbi:MAG TPA: SRPBCC family protein [Acidimicrobiia bacterium]|nr:SRPBCC family protein [Acidimicrobiia bacterium]
MSMTTSVETTQVYRVFIKASAQQIWDAITKPEFTTRYFHGARVDTTAKAGSPLRYYGPDDSLWGDDVIIEADPPRKLVATWTALWDPDTATEEPSRVTWEIDERDGGMCLLTVVHDRLEGAPNTAAKVSGEGWMMVLSGLKTLLETGEPLTG